MQNGNKTHGMTIVGLGTGSIEEVTRSAWEQLENAQKIYVRNLQHPALQAFNERLVLLAYQPPQDPAKPTWVEQASQQLLDLAKQEQVVYATPGNPLQDDAVTAMLLDSAAEANVDIHIIPGISLGNWTSPQQDFRRSALTTTIDALALAGLYTPPFPPTAWVQVSQLDSAGVAAGVKAALLHVYPTDWLVQINHLGTRTIALPLSQVGSLEVYSPYTTLTVPPLTPGTSIEDFQEIIAHLRAPNGCPWDRQQTHLTLRKHLLEEAYEAIEALDAQNIPGMIEEFGDLLLQIVLHAEIATESGEYHLSDVIHGIYEKIIRRHPHVFGDVQVEGVGGVLVNWEKLKRAEREANGEDQLKKGLLDGVPVSFPALAQAHEIQDRAARVGFDWPDEQGVMDKVREELGEVASAPDEGAKAAEIGDLLFTLVNLARWEKVDAEAALRATNARFRRRFAFIEKEADARGVSLNDLSLAEMDRLWEQAKEGE